MQSYFQNKLQPHTGLHVGIIMDGNGRWATAQGRPRIFGHRAGVEAVRGIAEAAAARGIATLTLYAFSSDNWRRPEAEVAALMALFQSYLSAEVADLVRRGTRLSVIGRRDRLGSALTAAIERAETETWPGRALHLRLAIDYSARDAILAAAERLRRSGPLSRDFFRQLVTGDPDVPDVDLLIRTGGEKRLSDFLLWESAYAELWFTDRMWPEFDARDLSAALDCFHRRERRFGGQPPEAAVAA